MTADGHGVPLTMAITAGQESDYNQADELIEANSCTQLVADRGYDSDHFRNMLVSKGIEPVIPVDQKIYKKHNAIERFFGHIKEFRRIATRYEKTLINFKAMFTFGGIIALLNL
jgi:transposase